MILVTGGTGNVGREVVRQLLDAGERVRVIARDPSRAALPEPAEVVPGDLTRPETLPAALEGTDRAFLFPVFAGLEGFLDAARRVKLAHVVLLSSSAVSYPTANWIGDQHRALEEAVAASGLPWTHVRPGGFMTNDLAWTRQIINEGVVRGVYGRSASAPVDPRDIAAVAVRALLDGGHAGRAYELTGPQSLTQLDRVRTIGEVIGRPVRFEEQPREQFAAQLRQRMPEPAAEFMLDLLASMEGATAEVLPTVEEVTGRPAYSYAEWIRHWMTEFTGPAA
ncbi:NAD(P)H-binding protein [Rugosimonospora acidiphila]|uniref:NAD(P)H-binding protein n=1 Tax=Rugosimonospora acidiphila TaxID=556531 RepID=A0ABP9S7W7_9ACTN